MAGRDLQNKIVEGDLDLSGATIESGLYLRGASIKGWLDLTTKSGPTKIYVDSKVAERIHWAAPCIPLVIVD